MLCVDTTAEEGYPPSTGCSSPITESHSFDASPTITIGFGVVVCSSYIMDLMGLVGFPPISPVSPDAIFHQCVVCFWFVFRHTSDGAK